MRLLDVINQQRILVEAQMNYATAQKDLYLAIVDLKRAIGEPVTK
jgi:outer membrane protein TolC